jgi:XRE family transcriptional regulator, regulator of sulfur utilization
MDTEELAERLALNVRTLREARNLTQVQIAKSAGIPRATWAHIESGAGNPTLFVLTKIALALSVPVEELIGRRAKAARHYPRESLAVRERMGVEVRSLLPHRVPNMVIERMSLPAGSRFVGTPHTPGTREYLTCESGSIELVASGERYVLQVGDVVVFRGDQKHSYANTGRSMAVGYSVVVLRPTDDT